MTTGEDDRRPCQRIRSALGLRFGPGHPQLVYPCQCETRRQVRIHGIAVPGIGGQDIPPFPHRQQIIGAHEPQHSFTVHYHSAMAQLRRHPAVPVEPILQHHALDQVAHLHVRLQRFVLLVVPIEAGPADLRYLAGMTRTKALKLHHASDLSVDAVAPAAVFFRRDSFTRLKALRKKSTSKACWPILRSNSAIRCAATSSGLAIGKERFRTPTGRPLGRCNPAAPCWRYASRQRYSTARLICSSCSTALTLSPSRIRWATFTLNSLVKTRFVLDILGPLPFN